MYQPQEPISMFIWLYSIFDVAKILWWISTLFTKLFFRYCEQQILSRISSSLFRILFSSESSNYLRVEEKSWLTQHVCEEHITDVFTSLSRECCKCPLRTAVPPWSTELRMIFIPQTAEPTIASAMCQKCVLCIVYLSEASSFLDHSCKLIAWKSSLKHREKGPLNVRLKSRSHKSSRYCKRTVTCVHRTSILKSMVRQNCRADLRQFS